MPRLAVLLALLAFAGCNTVEGIGRDIQSGGRAIEKGADEVRRTLSE